MPLWKACDTPLQCPYAAIVAPSHALSRRLLWQVEDVLSAQSLVAEAAPGAEPIGSCAAARVGVSGFRVFFWCLFWCSGPLSGQHVSFWEALVQKSRAVRTKALRRPIAGFFVEHDVEEAS